MKVVRNIMIESLERLWSLTSKIYFNYPNVVLGRVEM